ncbi:MAG: immunoglobulin domain-containing protein, partial [Bacteroidales bacterium]|nr:immunoglobulin domain-containing protein [Bacteroidales bacterium]
MLGTKLHIPSGTGLKNRLFIGLFILFSQGIYAQTLWIEDFEGIADNITSDDGSLGTQLNTAWELDNSLCIFQIGDYCSVKSNSLRGRDTDGNAVWTSEEIDLSGYVDINISVDLFEFGSNDLDDQIFAYYSLDGGAQVSLTNGNQSGDFGSTTATASGLNGSSLQIIIIINNNIGGPGTNTYYTGFDNVHVTGSPVTRYAIANGNWNSGSTWSYISGGSTCSCIPDEYSETFTDGFDVTINANADTKDLSVNGGIIDFSGNYSLTINNSGTLSISNGAGIDRGSTSSALLFDNGADFNLVVNDASVGLNIYEIDFHNINTVAISGSGIIDIYDDFEIQGSGVTITNDLSGTITLAWDVYPGANIHFNGCSNSSLINNGTIVNNNTNYGISFFTGTNKIVNNGILEFYDLDFHNLPDLIENYGTITQHGDFLNIDPGEAKVHNYAGAVWNFEGSSSDMDVELYCNYDANTFTYSRNGNQNIFTPTDAYWNLGTSTGGIKYTLADIEVNHDLTVGASTTLNGDQDIIYLAGNFSLSGDFNPGAGEVVFDGNEDQTFSTSSGTEYLNDVKVNKTAGELILDDNLFVTTNLYLNQGVIRTGGNSFVLSNPTSSFLNYTDGYIIGRFGRGVGSGTYHFPVGTVRHNGIFVSFPISPGGILYAEFIDGDPGQSNLPVDDDDQGDQVNHQFTEGYWTLDHSTGTSNLHNVTLVTSGFSEYSIDAATRVIHKSGGVWYDPVRGTHGGSAIRNSMDESIPVSPSYEIFGLGHPICELSIDSQPTALTNQCPGSNVQFEITASGGGTISYQWYQEINPLSDGLGISGATTNTLSLTGIDASDEGNYHCEIDNHCYSGTLSSNVVALGLDNENPTLSAAGDVTANTSDDAAGDCTVD